MHFKNDTLLIIFNALVKEFNNFRAEEVFLTVLTCYK